MNLCYVSTLNTPATRHPARIIAPSNMMPMLKSMIATGIPMMIQKAVLHANPRTANIPLKTRATRKIANIAINITDPPPLQ
mgnify:CR=1 FL=1